MKIYYLRMSTLYKIIAVIIVLIVLLVSFITILDGKAKETFKNVDDVFYKGNTNEKVIAFTCNIDWGNEFIPPMLEILKENNIIITFFVTGRWAEQNEDLLRKIYEHGHEIGNHGYLHRDYSLLSYEINKQEILKTDQIIRQTLNVKSKYFAPPSGAYNEDTVNAARDLNYNVIMWSIDTIDWRKDSTSDKIINRVVSKAHNSAIVLMHPKEETIKALPTIIKSLKEQGYKLGKISDIVQWSYSILQMKRLHFK